MEVSVENFKTKQKDYKVQSVLLSYVGRREFDSAKKTLSFKPSLPSVEMDTANLYSLRYTFKLKEGVKTPKQVCVKIEADYESDGEIKHFKDSVVYRKQMGLAMH